MVLVFPLLRGRGSDGENWKEEKIKMKQRGVLSAVGVAIILLLIMAFISPPVVYAADLEIECHVSHRSGYYNENFTYSVTVTNNGFWRRDITSTLLHIYPSETATDYHLQDNSTTIQIPSGQSKTVSFKNVRLSDPNVYNDLRRDSEYQEWLRNDRLSEWTQLWYMFSVELKSGEKLNCSGEGPILRKCLNVPDCMVTPIPGYYTDNFSYTVRIEKDENVNATLPDVRVTLYTYPNEYNDDVFCRDTKPEFDMEDNEISVTFDNISVTRSCFTGDRRYRDWLGNSSDISDWTESKYRFEVEWRGEIHECEDYDQIIQKPIFNCYEPLKVNYNATKCNFVSEISERGLMPFDFTAKVKIAEPDDNVTLKVRNYATSRWDIKDSANYTSEFQINETLDWHANLSKHNLETIEIDSSRPPIYILTSSFSYTFYSPKIHRYCDYPEHPANFIPHKRLEGTVESSVSPGEGTYNNTYTYNLLVKWPICDVFELQVRNYEKGDWDTMEELNYTTPNIDQPLFSSPIKLTSDHFSKERDGQYRFVSKVLNENFTFPGPIWTIDLTTKNITFSPKNGLYDSAFNFSMDVKANKNLTVKLFTRCPDGLEKDKSTNYIAPGWQPLNWSVRPCENEATGPVEYWFEFWYWSLDLNTWIPVKRIPVDVTKTLSGPSVWHAVFKNETVNPKIGNQNTRFDYSVNVTATIPGDVCLRIQKPDGGWKEKVECKPYNNSGSWQPISFNRIHVWHLVDEELGLAHYQFKFYEGDDCRGESEIFPGPELIEEQFTTDLLVDPEKGTNTTWFNFNTNAKWLFDTNVTKDVPITLQVSPDREADDADWINMTNKTYENVTSGEPIPIDFNVSIDSSDIPPSQKKNLTSKWVNKTIYWRVKGLIYNSTLNQTKWDIGLNCSNRSFSEKGWWNDAFNFSVNLSAKVNGSVELQLKTVKDGKVYTFDNRTYNKRPNSQLFNWTINLRDKRDEEYEGKTEYSFIFHYNNIIDECDWEDGPYLYKRLKIRFINSSVTPSKGIYYDENGILQKYFKNRNTLFNYTINISANKNTSIKPVIIDPRGNNRTIEDAKNYSDGNEIKELNWTIEAFKPERLCLGMWNYTFIYYNTTKNNYVGGWEEYEKQFEGPELVAVFKDFKIEPEELPLLYSETCNVTVSVNGSEDLNITLELCNSTVCKPIENGTKTYNMSEGEQQMVWKDIKPWKMFKSSDKLFFNFNITGVPSIGEEPDGFTMEPSAREPKVNPIRGHWDTSFNYSVEIRFDKEIEVELWVSLKDGEHYYKRKELYPGSGDWERIYWNAVVPFGDEKRTSRFMFKWNETDFLKEREKGNLKKVEGHGPIIDEYPPTFVKFRNGTVSKEEATYKDELNYSVEVNATKYVRIELLVQGPRINPEWGSMYNYSYNNIGGWQKLTWNKTKPFSKNVFKGGRSDFQFIAHHEGSGVDFPSSVYHGPDLKPLIELKPRVDPPSGKYDTLFNYIVELVNVKYINISDVKRNIKLVVCTPADEEIFFENPVFENSIGKWSIKPFKNDSKCSGTAHYYFKYDGDETDKYDGPNINITGPTPSPTPAPHRGGGGGGGGSSYKPYIIYEKAIVEPDPVSIRGVRENKSLNYSVVVDKDKTLILAIYNLSSNEWEEKGKGKKSELKDRKWKHKWNVNLTLDKNWEGKTCRYRFYPEGQQKYTSQVYYGPEIKIKVSLTDIMEDIGISDKPLEEPEIECEVTPKEGGWFKKFTYSTEIKHPDRANMTLLLFVYKPGSGEWKPVPWRKDRYNPIIRSSDYDEDKSNIATLSWTVEKKDVFDEGDAGKSSKFYIWYWDGYNEYNESKGSFDGPELLVNHEPEFVIALKPKPEYGSTHTVYEYVFDLSDPENDTVYGWLTITDPLGEDHVIESAGKEGSIQFRVGPGRGIFTEDKLREYLNKTNETIFRSRYRLEYWDECMNVLRKTNSTDWFVGPNVSLVKVENKTPKVEPGRGKYADEFEYEVGFYSSKDNTFWLNLTIYDPSSPDHAHQSLSTTLRVDADTTNYTSWKIAPNVFGPDDFGKNASYTIEWKDEVGNRGIITGSDPYIERAVPLLSHELPFVPISMVIAPLAAFGISLILVLSRFWDRLREWLGI